MPGWSKEQYEAKRAERSKKRQESAKKPLWWLGQTDPIARFTAYLAVFTFALVFVSAFQWYEIHSGSTDTHNLAEAAKAESIAITNQQRAWSYATARLKGPLIFRDDGAQVDVSFTLKNSGSVPAKNAYAWAAIFHSPLNTPLADVKERPRVCMNQNPWTDVGTIVFKDDPIILTTQIIKTGKSDAIPSGKRNFIIAGCVIYRSGNDPTIHKTPFLYGIVHEPYGLAIDKSIGRIDESALSLMQIPISEDIN